MKLLFISPDSPYPANSGGRIRTFNLLKEFAKNHQVDLVYLAADPDDAQQIEQAAGLKKVWHLQPSAQPKWRKAMPWFSPYKSRHLSSDIADIINQSKPDLVFVEFSFLLPAIMPIRQQFPHIKFILDAHNIEHQLHQEIANSSASLPFKLYKHLYAHFLKKIESQVDTYIDTIIAVSDQEALQWRTLTPKAKVIIAANGVDTDFFKPNQQKTQPNTLVFCGLMDYRPNVDAMIWFHSQIWPLVLAQAPDCQLYIVGRNPSQAIQDLGRQPNITVTGGVEDVRHWVAKAAISIVPLRSGAGTRLKILEAMAMGKVVVSTTIGAAGLQSSAGVILADQPTEFAQQVLNALSQPSKQLQASNRSTVEQYYSWKLIARKLASELNLDQG